MNPQISQKVIHTYASLQEESKQGTFEESLSAFLLALDLNGEGRFASWVWQMVTLAFTLKGEKYAQSRLDHYTLQVFSGDRHSIC
jgi:hypothetical protein